MKLKVGGTGPGWISAALNSAEVEKVRLEIKLLLNPKKFQN